MSLLLDDSAWNARIAAARGPLAALAGSLAQELEPLIAQVEAGNLLIPAEKALLSREGGRCAYDRELLDFDPFTPHEHRCPRCGTVWRGEWHDRFWPYWYQLWLAERAVHGALLHRLAGDERHRTLSIAILEGYVERYLTYPNRDNVLGPSRPFFSTYLESIWLLQLVIACDLLEGAPDGASHPTIPTLGARVRDRIVEPSVTLIASYDEGMSNRQVWNDAALLAAGTLLGDRDAEERAILGESGLLAQLEHALLPDGTWYEGENYHLFAHRGLWYSVTMLETRGLALPARLVRRFDEGFVTPFLTALPDLTLPSRRDSQYAISLRQPRFAELAELGLARRADDRLRGMLHLLYGDDAPEGDTARTRSTADVERNRPPARLTRDDLGWRVLLHALPDPGALVQWVPDSVLLESQGIAVFRRAGGRQYVALDYGHSGAGHGHPDRLDLLLAVDGVRWLDDMGTGSYVDRALHWYRSSLAHNAPLVNGHSQLRVHGRLLAHDERGAAGWVKGEAEIAPGVRARRTLVVLEGYLVDRVEWEASGEIELDLPMHFDGESENARVWRSEVLSGGGGLEDGFDFVHDAACTPVARDETVVMRALRADTSLTSRFRVDTDATLWRAQAPGPPGADERRFHLLRVRGARGRIDIVWSADDSVTQVAIENEAVVVHLADQSVHRHDATEVGWHIELQAAGARSGIDLEGVRASAAPPTSLPTAADRAIPPTYQGTLGSSPLRFALGEAHYLQSEQSWRDAGAPTAIVALSVVDGHVLIEVELSKPAPLVFVPAGTENPYDNEPAEVNGDGVQIYVATPDDSGGWLLVPDRDGVARARAVEGWGTLPLDEANWRPTPQGFSLRARIPVAAARDCAIDVIVNETAPGRQRRRGQLVLSGGGGFVYLRGDRQDPGRLLSFALSTA